MSGFLGVVCSIGSSASAIFDYGSTTNAWYDNGAGTVGDEIYIVGGFIGQQATTPYLNSDALWSPITIQNSPLYVQADANSGIDLPNVPGSAALNVVLALTTQPRWGLRDTGGANPLDMTLHLQFYTDAAGTNKVGDGYFQISVS